MIARAVALLVFLSAGTAAAQDGSITPLWMTPDAEIGVMPATRPAGAVASPSKSAAWRLGELAFRSPEALGGEARRAGLSCNSCHPAGGANTGFFIPGLSGPRGTIDVTHQAWNPAAEDGVFNPVRIPVLWNAAKTAPYGAKGRFPALDGFIAHVIRDEFAGEVSPPILQALTTYIDALPAPANAQVRPDGRLSDKASRDAHTGREAFEKGCAGCHRPAASFQDGQVHKDLNTPSLLGIAALGRFLHAGATDSLDEAIARHAKGLGISHGPETRRWIGAHVRAIGAIDPPAMVPLTIVEDVERIVLGTGDLLVADAAVVPLAARMLRGEIGLVHARLPLAEHADARAILEDWAEGLRAIGMAADAGAASDAQAAARKLGARMAADRPRVENTGPTSLYQPERLAAWKKPR